MHISSLNETSTQTQKPSFGKKCSSLCVLELWTEPRRNITLLTCVSGLLLSAVKCPNHFEIEWSHHCLLCHKQALSTCGPDSITALPCSRLVFTHTMLSSCRVQAKGFREEPYWGEVTSQQDSQGFFFFFVRSKIYDGFTTQAQEKPSRTKSLPDNRQKRSIDGVCTP